MKYLLALLMLAMIIEAGEPAGPESLVENYLQKDYCGEFLQQNNWLRDYVINPFMIPAWDKISVINGYKIQDNQFKENKCSVTVEYHIIGQMIQDSTGLKFISAPDTVTIDFVTKKTKFGWQILHPGSYPHVGLEALNKKYPAVKIQ